MLCLCLRLKEKKELNLYAVIYVEVGRKLAVPSTWTRTFNASMDTPEPISDTAAK